MNLLNLYVVSFPGLGINNLNIEPVAFRIGTVEIYWYGILIALAFLLCMFLILRQCERFDLRQDDLLDIFLITIPMAIIGARLYYVAFAWDQFKDNPARIFDTRQGGLAFYGGVIFGVLTVYIVSRVKKIPFHQLADFMIVYLPLGQGIGRWGNFFNQEAFGTNTTLPWGMYSDGTRSYLASINYPGVNPNAPVHPTFLYEFLGNMLIFFVLSRVRKQSRVPYETFSWYLLLYGLLRFFVESIRTDPLMIGDTQIRVSWLLSGIMVLVSVTYLGVIYIRSGRRRRREEMAIMLGQAADGKTLETAVPEVDEQEAARFDAKVAEAQGTGGRSRETKEVPTVDELDEALMREEARRIAEQELARQAADDTDIPADDTETDSKDN